MTISRGFDLATDATFRELSNFSTPPRAGRITAIEGNGQVRVETDDPDGGDVLAWPLNGFSYAVDDVVYVAFAVNNPESAIVIGSKGATPALATYLRRSGVDALTGDWDVGEDRRILLEALRARDGEGLALEDDAGNVVLLVKDGGEVALRRGTDGALLSFNDYSIVEGGNTHQSGFRRASSDQATFVMVLLSAANVMMGGGVSGDTFRRIVITAGGTFQWGSGSAARDTTLYRSSADHLKTDDDLIVAGDLSVGVDAAQGDLHIHTGTGGMIFVTKSGVNGAAQVVLANGSGDVTRALAGQYVWADGVSGQGSAFTMQPGDNVDTSFNGNTWRIALNANGEVSAQRTAGTGTGQVSLMFCWI